MGIINYHIKLIRKPSLGISILYENQGVDLQPYPFNPYPAGTESD